MEKTRAANCIAEVFTGRFDRERFRQFVHELLNRYDASKAQPMQVPDAFIQHIKSCQRLGTYQSPGGELLDGQIVFLYFIQKKGWLGVSKGGNWGQTLTI